MLAYLVDARRLREPAGSVSTISESCCVDQGLLWVSIGWALMLTFTSVGHALWLTTPHSRSTHAWHVKTFNQVVVTSCFSPYLGPVFYCWITFTALPVLKMSKSFLTSGSPPLWVFVVTDLSCTPCWPLQALWLWALDSHWVLVHSFKNGIIHRVFVEIKWGKHICKTHQAELIAKTKTTK